MTFEFLGFEFRKLELAHREQLAPFLACHPQPLTGFTFHTLMCWNEVYRYAWTFAEPGTLLISCQVDETGQNHLLLPLGEISQAVQEQVVAGTRSLDYSMRIFGVNRRFLESRMDFVAHFNLKEDPGGANYIYAAQDLAELPGKKFQKKRNLISQAQRSYSWAVEPLTEALAPACLEVLDEMRREDDAPLSQSLLSEIKSVHYSLAHFGELGQRGILVWVDDRPAAFSIFEPLERGTMVIHVEKALRRYKGLYQVVNQEAAKRIASEGFELINREEDMNELGLRQAKLSYNPKFIFDSFLLCSGGRPGGPPCERSW